MAFKVILVLSVFCVVANARPSLIASTDVDLAIISGSDAAVGAWPWQLSQQRLGTSWSHSCGASLLSATRALSAAHCLDGAAVSSIRVVAGQRDRTSYTGTQISNARSYKNHEQYQQGTASFANDIAIITLATAISTGSTVAFATLPPNNLDNFAGDTCVITGWGRDSSSNTLPTILQQANMTPLTTADCSNRIGSIGNIWANHICVYDSTNNRGACNGDSGGPLNCPRTGGYYVAGVTSWVVSSALGNCLVSYPSVYTRTSTYLSWISSNL
jgi:secreted trypsin-like serine protease